MRFEIETVKAKYNQFNAEIFNNELPSADVIKFETFKSKNALAMIRYPMTCIGEGTPTFRLNTCAEYLTEESMNTTIIHEMIHIKQWYRKTELGHGRAFKLFARTVKCKTNGLYDIKRCHGADVELKKDVNRAPKHEQCVVVMNLKDNSFRVYKNTTTQKVRNSLAFFSLSYMIYEYDGTMFNAYKSSKHNAYTITFFRNAELVERLKKEGRWSFTSHNFRGI